MTSQMIMRQHWGLNPEIDFLNHGSFGASPRCVLAKQREWMDQLEFDPIVFLAPERELLPKLDFVRAQLANFVNASPEELVFVRNSTDGVNAVMRSFRFRTDDEVIVTSHGYNACNNAVRFATQRFDAHTRVVEIPFPEVTPDEVVERVVSAFNQRTRLLLIDHVTSPTGLVFPIARLAAAAKEQGIRVMVDGAHAPGMLPINLAELGVDYYTANHHKWLCAPKTSGFLYVSNEWQGQVRPTVISHGANRVPPGRSRFQTEFDWVGTYDPTPILVLPTAIEFLSTLYNGGMDELTRRNHENALAARSIIADALEIEPPACESMIGSMVSFPLTSPEAFGERSWETLQATLFETDQFEVPIFGWDNQSALLRVCLQAYNEMDQVERLAKVLRERRRR